VDGVAVARHEPATPNGKAPIVMVHGGEHGAWVWERYGPFFASKGWECHALDWYGHGRSDAVPDFTERGITDVSREISSVSRQFAEFHLMGHSMGGLAALVSAAALNPKSLTLLAPVVPAEVNAAPVPVPVDLAQPFGVPPFEIAKEMFFSTMTDEEAEPHYARLQPESAQAVWEATRWTVSVDLAAVRAPTLVLGAGADTLTPTPAVRELARLMNATYLEFPGIGHSDLLLKAGGWELPAAAVESWLRALAPAGRAG
jgi:pimeloyl-ACP methyl ester carboxylesterase